jgi:hypothetical protein
MENINPVAINMVIIGILHGAVVFLLVWKKAGKDE